MNTKSYSKAGVIMMIVGTTITLSCFLGAFVWEDALSMSVQMACHIGFFVAPIAIKLGYVFKLIGESKFQGTAHNA